MAQHLFSYENNTVSIDFRGDANTFWSYTLKGSTHVYKIAAPTFEVDGRVLVAELSDISELTPPRRLPNGSIEYRYQGTLTHAPDLTLEAIFRLPEQNPVVRFAYNLKGHTKTHTLTKSNGRDELRYLGVSLAEHPTVTEVRFSEFVELVHSYCMTEQSIPERYFAHQTSVMGPLLCARNDEESFLVAYEHGSQTPDAFLQFHLTPERFVDLRATKGNYYSEQPLDAERGYQTLWLQFAAVKGDEAHLAHQYRSFVLNHQALQNESRKPYIFYNTWNYQERNKWWNGQPYLGSMHQERMLAEIDVAHRMGIDVFVIDTGWYIKTGDWQVNTQRFPDGLKTIKERLDSYGMKLGLWFDPNAAAISSAAYQDHTHCIHEKNGKSNQPHPIWETETSHRMCLVSDYGMRFAEELIRVAREVGVTYFKWDAIDQYGCSSAQHHHGNTENSEQERADCYSFQLIRAMTAIVERISEEIPEAIVDFDVTERNRAVGLSFLSVGKYFLINNGPYYWSFDIKFGPEVNPNLFFYPGNARGWICRTPLPYDKWLPSVLFLTHYLPDDPRDHQTVSLASLMLGQNGIWGDLVSLSAEGVAYFDKVLTHYKLVRDDITSSTLIHEGRPGGSPEFYEKINEETGRGVMVAIAAAKGRYTYITTNTAVEPSWHTDGVLVTSDTEGRARLEFTFENAGAHIIIFGA